MTDTTIANIPIEQVVIANTDWFEGQKQGGDSFKAHVQGLRGLGGVNITTSAVSQDVGPEPQVVYITTGGTGGEELINIVTPTLDGNGYNTNYLGSRVFVVLAVQTDPADTVTITIDGGASCPLLVPIWSSGVTFQSSSILDFVGASICFVWCADAYQIDSAATDRSFNRTFRADDVSIGPEVPTTGAGKTLFLDAGQGDTNGFIRIGFVVPLPTADPTVSCSLWNDGGNPKLSGAPAGASGTFTSNDGKTITVTHGVITSIV
jgi:hypothetical protein